MFYLTFLVPLCFTDTCRNGKPQTSRLIIAQKVKVSN